MRWCEGLEGKFWDWAQEIHITEVMIALARKTHGVESMESIERMQDEYLMVKFSITSGKCSSSSLSSSKVIQPLLSVSADSKRAFVRSSNFSSGKEIELSFRHDLRTVRNSSGSIEPLPARKEDFHLTPDRSTCKRLDSHGPICPQPLTMIQLC